MCDKWANLSVIEKLSFISRLNAIETDLVFNSIGRKKLTNVLWLLDDEFKEGLENLLPVAEAADFFIHLPKERREKLVSLAAAES